MSTQTFIDSLKLIQPTPYKDGAYQVPQSVRIEGPIGAIEVDSGNAVMDGSVVVIVIVALYVCK